ncbi:MAG: M20/M25/M40 family metallo-hydrolase [bacterium]
MKHRTPILIVLSILVHQIASAQVVESEEITVPELRSHVAYLASDSLKGRKPGTPEDRLAAEYIRDCLEKNGLTLLGDGGFQHFQVVTSVKMGRNNQLSIGAFNGEPGKHFMPLSFSASRSVTATVLFVGYGFDIESDTLSWNDYKSMDVSGKWALIQLGSPETENPNSLFAPFSALRKKALVAKDHGAAGVLFISGVGTDQEDALTLLSYDQSQADAGIPVLHVKRDIADRLLEKYDLTVAALEKRLNESRQPQSFSLGETVTGSAEIIMNNVTTQNIVALLPGSDPILKDETIILGAHYDHLGLGGPGSGSRKPDTTAVHNGADDNGSGVAAILEIVEQLAAQRHLLKRSVVCVAFGAEEMGTVGSRFFVENPLIDLKRVRLMLNLDMVGRLNPETKTISVGGTGTAVGLLQIVEDRITKVGLKASYSPEGFGPSDHASFYAKDIPVLSFMTSMHEDYHTPDDDVEKLDFEGEKVVADLIASLLIELANRREALVFQEAGPKTRPVGPRFKVTLGIMPDIAASGIKGLRATAVMPGRPAAQAGMKKGDIIVAMEGKPVNDIYEYMHRLSEFRPGQRISVEVLRDGKKEIFIVEL